MIPIEYQWIQAMNIMRAWCVVPALVYSLFSLAIDLIVKNKRILILLEFLLFTDEIIYVFLTIFLYLLKCPQSLILSALRAFCFCGKAHIPRSIFLYFRYQSWLKSW